MKHRFTSKHNIAIGLPTGAAIFREGVYETDSDTVAAYLRNHEWYGTMFNEEAAEGNEPKSPVKKTK